MKSTRRRGDPAIPAAGSAPNNERDDMEKGPLDFTCRVAEALPKDVGRGLARLDPKDMAELGVEIGDVVEVVGKQTTVARVMPTHADLRGKRSIQIDGIARANAGAGLGEQVTVRRAEAKPARSDRAGADRRSGARRGRTRRPLSDPPARRHTDGHRRPGARQSDRHADAQFRRWQGGAAGAGHRRTDHHDHLRRRRRAPRRHHLRGCRRPAQGNAPRPRDHRAAAQIPGGLRASRHRGAQRRPALRPAGHRQDVDRARVAHESNVHFIHVNGPEIIDKFYGASEAQSAQDVRGGGKKRSLPSSSSTRSTPSRRSASRWRASARSNAASSRSCSP